MACPRCGKDNPGENLFCGGCGTSLRDRPPDDRILQALERQEQGKPDEATPWRAKLP